jgi:hypothetical protein
LKRQRAAPNAHDRGYKVVFVVDAMMDRDVDVPRYIVEKVFPRLGETDAAENVLKLLK